MTHPLQSSSTLARNEKRKHDDEANNFSVLLHLKAQAEVVSKILTQLGQTPDRTRKKNRQLSQYRDSLNACMAGRENNPSSRSVLSCHSITRANIRKWHPRTRICSHCHTDHGDGEQRPPGAAPPAAISHRPAPEQRFIFQGSVRLL